VHVGQHTPIERLDETQAGFVEIETADDGRAAALENTDNPTFEAVVARPALDADQYAVAMHRFLDIPRRHVHVRHGFPGLVGNDETEAARVGLQTADDEIHFVGEPDAVPFCLNQLARGDERFEQPAERRAFFLRDSKRAKELARRRRVRDFVTH
jgi:hypothetical protein